MNDLESMAIMRKGHSWRGKDNPAYKHGESHTIEDKELGFHLGNAIKYIARAGKKTPDAKEDIEKAIWYLERYLGKI